MPKSQSIAKLKKRFHRQWLLIAVDRTDESTTTPLSGTLLAHSPYRDEIHRKLRSLKKRWDLLVECSEDSLPKGYAAAF